MAIIGVCPLPYGAVVGMQIVIVAFPGHTQFLVGYKKIIILMVETYLQHS